MTKFLLSRKINGEKKDCSTMAEFFDDWRKEDEHLLFVVPHDDDIVIPAGLLIQLANLQQIRMSMLIVSDGKMGYCSETQRENIVDIRRQESMESFKILGVKGINWLNFPDGSLQHYMGRRLAKPGDPCIIADCTGLENALVNRFRSLRPTRIFVTAGSDYHLDHKAVYDEVLISIFHAQGDIWPELGKPLDVLPKIYEMAIYADFEEEPNMKVMADKGTFQRKLQSIQSYQSQKQIKRTVSDIRKAGPIEYFRDIKFRFYSPANYKASF